MAAQGIGLMNPRVCPGDVLPSDFIRQNEACDGYNAEGELWSDFYAGAPRVDRLRHC
jgi:hypothetical protein